MRRYSTKTSIRRTAWLFGAVVSGFGLATLASADQQASSGAQGIDSLQWLEGPKEARALKWAKDQTERSRAEIERMPEYARVHARLLEALKASAPVADVSLGGSRAMRLQKDADHPHGQLQIADSSAGDGIGQWRTVLDVEVLRKSESKPWELQWSSAAESCLPPEFTRCLLRMSPGGGDEVELREFDLAKGNFVADGFNVPLSRAFAVWLSKDHVLVAHTLFGSPKTAAGYGAAVRSWHRGEQLKSAKSLFEAPGSDAILQLSASGQGPERRAIVTRAIDYSTFAFSVITQAGKVIPLELPQHLKPFGILTQTDHHLVMQLSEAADAGGKHFAAETLLGVDISRPDQPKIETIYVPPAGEYLIDFFHGYTATRNAVHFVATRALVPHVLTATVSRDAWKVHEEFTAEAGQSLHLNGGNPTGTDLILKTTGLLTPTRQELWSPGRPRLLIASETPVMDTSKFTVEARSAISRDKTPVDYLLLRPRDAKAGTPTPTLMTGYGAFGLSFTTGYFDYIVGGRSFAVWLDHGGALVIPAARGGSERGDAWHRIAMREHRQLSYDDFTAVAEALIKSGFTTPAHFGIFGSSNGGLLSATMATERPDLFGAVVSDVPLTDMLRFPKMGMGSAWMDEYGNPDNPQEAAALKAYSPLHNVRANVKYPPFLITISTEDSRVGPGHARKFAARLMEVGAKVYFIEDQEGGHGVSEALERPDIMAARLTFLLNALVSPH
jgi:prolyl oligopeptidase